MVAELFQKLTSIKRNRKTTTHPITKYDGHSAIRLNTHVFFFVTL